MLIAVGALLALVILSDAIRTTINLSERRGPIARAVLFVGRRVAQRLPVRSRAGSGIAITIMIVLSWTLGLWLAWTIALFDPAITMIDTATGEAVGGVDIVYVAGYAIFTLGTGDLAAATAVGRFVTVFASATGLFTVTMEVTYLVSLTSAAAHERKTARQAYAIGHDVDQVLRRSWNGASFAAVEPVLLDLASDLGQLAEQHRTFPVLHDVLPAQRSLALGPTLLALADALELMHRAVPADQAIGVLAYAQVIEAMDGLLQGLPDDADPDAPPEPADPSELLSDLGATYAARPVHDDTRRARRRALYGLAREEGWEQQARDAIALTASGR